MITNGKVQVVSKESVLGELIKRISKISSVIAVYEFGNPKYIEGISDIDLIIVTTDKVSYQDILRFSGTIFRNTLFIHKPFFIPESLLGKLVTHNVFLCNVNDQLHSCHRALYTKSKVIIQQDKVESQSYLYGLIEYNFLKKLYFNMKLRNNFLSQRLLIKAIKNNIYCINIINKLYSVNVDLRSEEYLQMIINSVIDTPMKPLQANDLFRFQSKTEDILENIQYKVISKKLTFLRNKKEKNVFISTKWGRIGFIQNYTKRKRNIWLFFLEKLGVTFFDSTILNYMKLLKDSIDGVEQSNILSKRAKLLQKWWNYLESNNLMNIAAVPNGLVYLNLLYPTETFIDKFLCRF